MPSNTSSLKTHRKNTAVPALMVLVPVLALAACDSDSDSDDVQQDPQSLEVTLVAPTTGTAASEAGSFQLIESRDDACPNVPAGYFPLISVDVSYIDTEGNELSGPTATTDECGFLSTTLPQGTESIKAQSDGNRELIAGVSSIVASGGIASTIPANANYRVGFFTQYDATTLGFTVTDDVTNKAVVGLPLDAFDVDVDGSPEPLTSLQTGLSGEEASIVLVTDASGSMSQRAFEDPATGIDYSRNNLSAIAAHQFLDQKASDDEAAMLIFDNQTDFMNDESLADLVNFVDENGDEATYQFSESGFSQDSAQLRLIVDLYNEDSQLWRATNSFERHPDTPALTATNRYAWGSATAFYPATVLASEKLLERPNPRRFIVAMTDGKNNRGSFSLSDVINTANQNGTPVYTIGFEFTEEEELTRLANDTGATYYQANSLEVSDAYASIQTNIVYQYTGTIATELSEPSVITLIVDINGDGAAEATRELVTAAP